ncbi:LamG-like jellyroll fold domain-containing protein, partial [Oerskovia flava]|uniref:LamG-like jellyroll fold domain-containing protein n=1 Tax=Oerskovia flava TaxID=2986422 RepID=UPI0022409DFB
MGAVAALVAGTFAVTAALPVGADPDGVDLGTAIRGDVRADSRTIGGEIGQDVAANFLAPDDVAASPSTVSRSLWWTWRAPSSGPITFTTHGSELDTLLNVFPASSPESLIISNDDDGDVSTSSVTFDAVAGEDYLVEVEAKSDDAGLLTLAWQPVAPAAAPEPDESTSITSTGIPLTGNTGEKPQSKLWHAGGSWWAVLASASTTPAGTWVWRYDDAAQTWTNVHRVSERTDVRADVKSAGDVAHVLLHGPTTTLVSIQRVAGTNTYEPWTQRTGATTISLPGSETATLDIDTTGRMWVASDTSSAVQVRHSAPPYTSFSSPVTLATGITDDDLALVTAMPGGKIGVLWSDQSRKRFGFRTHADGANASTWTADERPAQSSGLSLGGGMADDHLNVAMSDDGTLYAAVKTSYNSSSAPVIGLLVRHPDGTWDPLHEVDRTGTRPIVVLDDETDRLRVLYTRTTGMDLILEKETSRTDIDFDFDATTAVAGAHNNVTGAKDNVPGAALVLASSASSTSSARLPWLDPTGPTAVDGTVSTTVGTPVEGVLGGSAASGASVVFEVVAGPSSGEVEVAGSGAFVYSPAAGFTGVDSFSFRVGAGGEWSNVAVMTVRVVPADGLLGAWDLDEGSGVVAGDSSGWGGDGALVGGVSWVPGVAGAAVSLDGSTGHVLVPDGEALDVSGSMTVAAWVRPDSARTQYVVKKAAQGSTDGYELGLANGGKAFLRFNHATSGDTFRVNATSSYPTDGQTWVHLAGTFDGSKMRIYVDGVLQGTVNGPSSIGTNSLPLGIGAESNGTRSLDGSLDGVRLYDRALSAAQIGALLDTEEPPAEIPVATGGSVTTVAGTPVEGVLGGSAASGASVVFEVVAGPSSGEVEVAGSGAFVYSPAAGFTGVDSFSFRVGAGGEWSNVAVMTVRVVPADGLLGAWDLDEGSGVVAGDSSGWGGDGALVGGVSWVPGVAGAAVSLDGSTGHVLVPDGEALDVSGSMTVAAWVRPDSARTQYVVKKAAQGSTDGYELGLANGGKAFLRFNHATSGDTFRVNATSSYPTDGQTWVHLAGTFDGSKMRIYVDGVLQGTVNGPSSIGTNSLPLGIGAESNGTRSLDGSLDGVRLYDRALSAAQIGALLDTEEPPA